MFNFTGHPGNSIHRVRSELSMNVEQFAGALFLRASYLRDLEAGSLPFPLYLRSVIDEVVEGRPAYICPITEVIRGTWLGQTDPDGALARVRTEKELAVPVPAGLTKNFELRTGTPLPPDLKTMFYESMPNQRGQWFVTCMGQIVEAEWWQSVRCIGRV